MWTNILGHAAQIAQLRQSLAQETLAHAYLFAGPEGVGKRQVAFAMASALTQTPVARIAAGQHPDVLLVAPSDDKALREISVEQIRDMQARLHLHPLEGEFKLALLDTADAMHPSAANACLKILEEPPTRTHFILISSQPHRLLPTIRSRCQTITFGPLPTDVIITHLLAQGFDSAEARQRALLSEGSLGLALNFPAEVVAETMTDLHQLLAAQHAPTILHIAERWSADATLLPWRFQLLGLLWRDALAQRLGRTAAPSLPATASLIQQLLGRTPYRLHAELEAALHTSRDLADTTLNKQLCCEALLFSLSAA